MVSVNGQEVSITDDENAYVNEDDSLTSEGKII